MITTKQRAHLRGLAMKLNPSMQIGKESLKEQSFKQIEDMLFANELVKIKVLKSCDDDVRTIANKVSEFLQCDVVQVIGNVFVVYKRSSKKDIKHIELE